jgi:site-specific DNA-methyltransferase (adenine-specific)
MKVEIYNEDCLTGMNRIADGSVDMILCDLPYGTTDNKWDSVIPLESLWTQYKRVIKSNGAIVLTAQVPFNVVLGHSNLAWLRYEWIWSKSRALGFLNAKKMPMRDHENVLVFYRSLPTYNPQGLIRLETPEFKPGNPKQAGGNYRKGCYKDRYQEFSNYPRTLLRFPSEGNTIHPTQKPVALFEYLVRTYTNEGETVLDNCLGSGTSAIACVNSNRNFIGFELDTKYFAGANRRIEAHQTIDVQKAA